MLCTWDQSNHTHFAKQTRMHLQAPMPSAVKTQNPIVSNKQQQTKLNAQKEERNKRAHAHQHWLLLHTAAWFLNHEWWKPKLTSSNDAAEMDGPQRHFSPKSTSHHFSKG